MACASADPEPGIISELLKVGHADPNAQDNKGQTPLHRVSASGNLRSLALLITAGADRTVRDEKMKLEFVLGSQVLIKSLCASDEGCRRIQLHRPRPRRAAVVGG